MNYGLSDKNITTMDSIFRNFPSLKKVILYGSRAIGNYKNGSDIDITIETDTDFSRHDYLRLCGELSESNLPYFVDCSIFSKIKNKDLLDHIKRVGKVFWVGEKLK